jgi:hypothetical protein
MTKLFKKLFRLGCHKKMPHTHFPGSADYWENRYSSGGDSGVGSYGFFAEFKASVLNDFVSSRNIKTVIELGFGDGHQLEMAKYPDYLGFDVSNTTILKCRELFKSDKHKSFRFMNEYNGEKADLSLSLDVIFHLVEDNIFEHYMHTLFEASNRYVIIYSSDSDDNLGYEGSPHIRHRKFSNWIGENLRGWRLIAHIPNQYPYHGDYTKGSFCDFFIYKKDCQMDTTESIIKKSIETSKNRMEFWTSFLNSKNIKHMAEIGVYAGYFAERILKDCGIIERYYMIDPWRHLDKWNKPENNKDDIFEQYLSQTLSKTNFAAHKRIILRGKTTEIIENIPDSELDFAYVDGDHTLKGISIDLIRIFPKIKKGGWIGGDDFTRTVWQHTTKFEPTLVFPFAVYFAEAVNARIYALPFDQFLIEKNDNAPFAFIDLTGYYKNTSLRFQFRPGMGLKTKFLETFPRIFEMLRRANLIELR